MRAPKPVTGWRKGLRAFNKGLMTVLRPLQIVSNFVFLSAAYFIGVGASSLLYRMGPRTKRAREANPPPPSASSSGVTDVTYWRELPAAPRDRDAWLRPF